MSVCDGIAAILKTDTTLSKLPIHFDGDPQTVSIPKITLRQVGQKRENSNDGDAGVATTWIEVKVISGSRNDCATLTRAAMVKLAANMAGTFSLVKFAGIFIEAQRDLEEPVDAGKQKPNQLTVLSVRANHYDALN